MGRVTEKGRLNGTLVVYTAGASLTQELTMMREIIRARMERLGGAVSNIVVKTSRPGFERK